MHEFPFAKIAQVEPAIFPILPRRQPQRDQGVQHTILIPMMKSICIYCGSALGTSARYASAARELAQGMVAANIGLVYGGGNIGLMGVIASEVMRLGGQATGIIPEALLSKEIGHLGLTHLHIVKDMHQRKAMMAELSDGFIAMPGGLGTLEELFEVFTWHQLGLHNKPIGLLNVDGFYDGLIAFISHQTTQGFLHTHQAEFLMNESNPAALLARFNAYLPAFYDKFLDKESAEQILR